MQQELIYWILLKKTDLANLKLDLDKLDIDKLKNNFFYELDTW